MRRQRRRLSVQPLETRQLMTADAMVAGDGVENADPLTLENSLTIPISVNPVNDSPALDTGNSPNTADSAGNEGGGLWNSRTGTMTLQNIAIVSNQNGITISGGQTTANVVSASGTATITIVAEDAGLDPRLNQTSMSVGNDLVIPTPSNAHVPLDAKAIDAAMARHREILNDGGTLTADGDSVGRFFDVFF